MKIGIQGEKFSWHYLAAKKMFGNDINVVYFREFSDVFRAEDRGEIDYGLVAIENSVYGSINTVYQELSGRNYFICGEITYQINQCLLAKPTTKLEQITDVYSHPVALHQCREWLDKNLPNADQHAYFDTSISAQKVAKSDSKISAIGAKELANDLGLAVIADGINTDGNYTRFIAFSKDIKISEDANKTSIILTTGHQKGALYKALGCFYDSDINLTKLESRPVIGSPFKYQFYIDLETRLDSNEFKKAQKQLEKLGSTVQIIGCYKADAVV